MRTPRCHVAHSLDPDCQFELDPERSHYLLRVLRLKPGDLLILFNGDGCEYPARLVDMEGKRARIRTGSPRRPDVESPLHIELGQGISRGERMDWALQKSVELGVAAITPIWAARTEVRLSGTRLDKRLAHWRGVIRSACEQSGRLCLPTLSAPAPLGAWCKYETGMRKLVLAPDAKQRLTELEPAHRLRVLIGPEGGLEENEIETARAAGFTPVRIGPRVLRTETAAAAVIAALQTLWGDFGR
ncbi:MAG TPA: 16S rRNA (uracil(1498)-N(3))-methyltransferase [Gammaproteobacteria bacterium]|nr:16S rRNA (uracil(1498)-N(3))-methyltransferase [Gammaproteobacteria bacterium]